jgi:hypothetical protein
MATQDSATPQEVPSLFSLRLLSRKKILCALAIGFFLFYAVEIFVRSSHGIRVVVQNESGTIVKKVTVKFEQGKQYSLGEIASGKTEKIFVVPGAESNIRLDYVDPNGRLHSDIVAGYVENGYCDDVTARIMQDFSVTARDDSCLYWNWKSWYGFL